MNEVVVAAAVTEAVLAASLGALAVGALLLQPSLWWLYAMFQREHDDLAIAQGEDAPIRP